MTDAGLDPQDAAIAWHIAMPAMDEEQWHAFTAWLEADIAHAAAYDAVTRADHSLSQLRGEASSAVPVSARHPFMRLDRKPVWIGMACAASLAGLLLVGMVRMGWPDSHYAIATPAGFLRTVAMGEGSKVALNGATRMAFDRDEPRSARLEEGEALFSVRHDADKPFIVIVGRFKVEDLGTVFNIVRANGRLSVAVAEGRVLFDPGGANLTLGAGDAVTVDEKADILTRGKAVKVGGWSLGDMAFVETPLGEVAAAIHRRTGADILVSAPLSNAPFTGNIHISGDPDADARHLANLVGADIRRDGGKWILSPARVPG